MSNLGNGIVDSIRILADGTYSFDSEIPGAEVVRHVEGIDEDGATCTHFERLGNHVSIEAKRGDVFTMIVVYPNNRQLSAVTPGTMTVHELVEHETRKGTRNG